MHATQIIVLLLLIPTFVNAAESNDDRVRRYYSQQNYKRAIPLLKRLIKNRKTAPEQQWLYRMTLAECLRHEKRVDEALTVLNDLSFSERAKSEARLQFGYCFLAQDDVAAAVEQFALCSNDDNPRLSCPANYELARIHFEQKAYQDCIQQCKRVIAYGRGRSGGDLVSIVNSARTLLAKAKALLDLERYGPDYIRYRDGRRAQANGAYQEALKHYETISTPVLIDAAHCYSAYCRYQLGDTRTAFTQYQTFIDSNAFGLYRGEALLRYAEFVYLSGNTKHARQLLNDALAWHREIKNHPPTSKWERLQTVLADFPVPNDMAGPNDFGVVIRKFTRPETIINRATTPWYLAQLKLQTYLLYGFVCTQQGETGEAVRIFERTAKGNAIYNGKLLTRSGVERRLIADAERGAFLISTRAWSTLSNRYRTALQLAFFYYVAGENGKARTLFDNVVSKTGGKLSRVDAAACALGLGLCNFRDNRQSDAIDQLVRFTTTFKSSELSALGQFVLANIYSGRAEKKEDAYTIYESISKSFRRSPVAPKALLALAISACNHRDHDVALKASRLLQKRFQLTAFADCGKTIEQALEETTAALVDTPPQLSDSVIEKPSNRGRLIGVRRHLLYPGGGDLRLDYARLHRGDVLRYEVTYSTRSECIVIRGFRLRLSEFEPQMTPVNTKTLAFIRAPALFVN